MRNYLARCDDGHDYFEFEFCSDHRANSKANLEDAKNYYRRHHGKRKFTIIETRLYNTI